MSNLYATEAWKNDLTEMRAQPELAGKTVVSVTDNGKNKWGNGAKFYPAFRHATPGASINSVCLECGHASFYAPSAGGPNVGDSYIEHAETCSMCGPVVTDEAGKRVRGIASAELIAACKAAPAGVVSARQRDLTWYPAMPGREYDCNVRVITTTTGTV